MAIPAPKFYITTPIYYVNDAPHIGGAYTTIAADVLARWHRMRGEEVFFLTGTDEHGQKVAEAAREQKKSPRSWCDENAAKYQMAWDTLRISNNNFIRTTDPSHEKIVPIAVQKLYDKNLIYQGVYKGLYCVGCERYYTVKELVQGKCPFHQKEPLELSEKCYFFKLSAFQKPLLKLIDTGVLVIEPKERKNEVLGFLRSERLEDLAISREKVEWGIPIPWDKAQTVYVWIDALLNYLSGIGWDGKGKLPEIWPPEVQLIGKDIIRFHCVIWPSLLLALEIPLPKKIYVHGFFTVGERKMSKSLGNIILPEKLVSIFGSDSLRWLLLNSFPFGQDGDLSLAKFYDKYNAELANGIGNLVSRVLTLAVKNKKGFSSPKAINLGFKQKIDLTWKVYEKALEEIAFEEAAMAIQEFEAFCDRHIDKEKPWKLFKEDIGKYQEVMYNLLEGLRQISWMVCPFMPDSSDKIFTSLGTLDQEHKKTLEEAKKWGRGKFKKITRGQALFPRL